MGRSLDIVFEILQHEWENEADVRFLPVSSLKKKHEDNQKVMDYFLRCLGTNFRERVVLCDFAHTGESLVVANAILKKILPDTNLFVMAVVGYKAPTFIEQNKSDLQQVKVNLKTKYEDFLKSLSSGEYKTAWGTKMRNLECSMDEVADSKAVVEPHRVALEEKTEFMEFYESVYPMKTTNQDLED